MSIKIKCKESFGSFGTFNEDFPHELTGVLDPLEYRNVIRTINSNCKSSFNKGYLLFLLGPIAGIVLFILGGIKFKKIQDEQTKDWFNNWTSGSYYFPSSSSSSGFQYNNLEGDLSPTKGSSFKPGLPWFYFVVGAALFLFGCCFICCAYFIFKRKVLGKIEECLIPINQNYSSRQIKFDLITEINLKPIPQWEYNTHRGNQAYMNQVKYDSRGNPCKEEEEHFLLISFSQNSAALLQQQQMQHQQMQHQQMQHQQIQHQQMQHQQMQHQQMQHQQMQQTQHFNNDPQLPPYQIQSPPTSNFSLSSGTNPQVQIEMESFI